jgi:nitrite reductase (cytochrome c-552)
MIRKLPSSFAMAIAAVGVAAISSGIGLAVTLARSQSYPINDDVDDPAVWGKIFPLYYELYRRTADMQRTRHGGSEAEPRTPVPKRGAWMNKQKPVTTMRG